MKKIKKLYDSKGRLLEEIIYDECGKIIESISYEYEPPSSPFLFPSIKDLPKEEPEEFILNEQGIDSTNSSKEDSETSNLYPEEPSGIYLIIISAVIIMIILAVVIASRAH